MKENLMDEKNFTTRQSKSSKDIIEFYDDYAKSWDQRFGETESTKKFHQIRKESFLEIAELSKTQTAIELGVGTGPYVAEIASMVKELICIDGSKEMLKVLGKKVRNHKNVKLMQMNLSKPIGNGKLQADIVYSFALIEHIIKIDNLIDNCEKMLKPDGKIIFVSPNALSPWYYGLRRFFRVGFHCTTDRYYSRYSIGKIMKKHGFKEMNFKYWGFFPAGVEGLIYKLLNTVGSLIEKTPLRIFSGGITVSYQKE